jgi:cell surface protein SprA
VAFDNDPNAITIQDVGLNGLSDEQERNFRFRNEPSYLERIEAILEMVQKLFSAPLTTLQQIIFRTIRSSALDNAEADILERYKFFNNPQGNSNTSQPEGFPSAATTRPDVEDINQDQTLSRSEAYFQYRISIRQQDLVVGQNHITDIFETQTGDLPDGTRKTARWIQFKVPVFQPDRRIGPISDFRSIRFIRLFMRGFSDPIVLRMARMELLRGEWRRYMFSLDGIRDELEQDEDFETTFETNVVNLEENGQRSPINYTLPPGIERQQFFQTSSIQAQNEQSLSLSVCNLRDGDARAVFRNLAMDMRLYKRLRMFVHVEERLPQEPVRDGDLNVFIRVGSDYNQNYYEYEISSIVSPWGATDPREIWPENNEMVIDLQQLRDVKLERDRVGVPLRNRYTKDFGNYKITVVGAPNLGNTRTIMIGVRNPKKELGDATDDGLPKCAEVWVNELRLGGFDRQGGFAANARMNAQLADFGNITLTGNYSSIAFGALDQSVTERSMEEIMSYDLQTSWELGKFFSEDVKLRIPLFYSMAEEWRNPRFNPLDPDIEFRDALANIEEFAARDSIRKIAQTYNMRRSFNFANVRKERSNTQRKPTPLDIENLALSYAFSEHYFRDINTVFDIHREHRAAINYSFQSRAKPWEPFKNVGFLKNKNFAIIRDLSIGYMPSRMVFRTDAIRMYNEMQMRNTDSPLFQLDTTFNKTFTLNRQYDLGYDLTKALRVDFQARMNTWIDELPGSSRDAEVRESIRQSLREFGRPVRYNQTLSVNWEAPIKKLPYLDFVSTVNVRYTGDFDWQANSLIAQMAGPEDDSLNLGNTIQNASSMQINGQLNFVTLYNKVKFLREINQGKPRAPQRGGPQGPSMQRGGERGGQIQEPKEEEKPSLFITILKATARIGMSLRSANLSFTQTEGTMLPGFMPKPSFFGMDNWSAPTPGFVFGSQQDIRPTAAENGWLSTSPLQNSQFSQTFNQNLNARATIEPIQSLRLELTATQNRSDNLVEFFRFNPVTEQFESQNPFFTGMFTTSVIALGTSFESVVGPEFNSSVYNQFLVNREIISRRRAQAFAIDNPDYIPEVTGSPDSANYGYIGFSYTSQGVMIPAFIAAYLGEDAKTMSLSPRSQFGNHCSQ